MISECRNIREILDAQLDIIERHIEQHKWFRHIDNTEDAVRDFIEKYGFIMRELYCSRICDKRFDCEYAKQFKPK